MVTKWNYLNFLARKALTTVYWVRPLSLSSFSFSRLLHEGSRFGNDWEMGLPCPTVFSRLVSPASGSWNPLQYGTWPFSKGAGLWFFPWPLSNVTKWLPFLGECFPSRSVYKLGVFVDANGPARNGDKTLIKTRLVKLRLEACFSLMAIQTVFWSLCASFV